MLFEEIKNIKSAPKDLRNFGLTVGLVLVFVGGVFWWLGKPFYPYLLMVGIILVSGGFIFPGALKPLQKVWMTIAVVIGWVMTRVILSLLFFLVFTTLGLVARLFGKEFLALKWKRADESYWNYRKPQEWDKQRSEMQF